MSTINKNHKGIQFINKTKSLGFINFNKLLKQTKSTMINQSLSVIEKPKKELTEDEKCDLEVFSILNGTPDADEFFHYDGDEIVVDKNVFFRNDYFIDTEDY